VRHGGVEHLARQDARHGEGEARLGHRVGGQKVNASKDDPRYLVESEKSGKEAAHKPDALSKV
jgi:Hypervirulence associated proteins TUDOR domain